jgi:hypothetical protein
VTAAEFDAARKGLGFTVRGFARFIDVDPRYAEIAVAYATLIRPAFIPPSPDAARAY